MSARVAMRGSAANRALVVLVALLLGLTTLAGCSTMREARATQLDNATSSYRKLIRWGELDEAAKYLRARDGKPVAANLKHAGRYRVTSYTVANQFLANDGKDARVIALIEYYELDSGVIRTLHDEQQWWYDEKEKHWFLESSLPAFGTEDSTQPVDGPPAR